jgi:hypothetical protein
MAFDDNASATAAVDGQTNLMGSFQPQFRLALTRPRLSSSLYYSPGFTYSTDISGYNNSSHALGADFEYGLTRRWSVHFQNAFNLSTSPFQELQANAELPSSGLLESRNVSVLGANVRSTTEQSSADTTYLLGSHTSVGIGGTFSNLSYEALNATAKASVPGLSSRSWSTHAFYSHRLTSRYALGVQYIAQSNSSDLAQLSSQDDHFSSLSHAILGFWTVSFRPGVQLSVFAGPERLDISDSLKAIMFVNSTDAARLSFSGGASLTWQGEHNGLSSSFTQRVSDAGLSGGGAVNLRSAALQIQHQVTRRSSVNFFGNCVFASQIDPFSTVPLTDSASAGFGFTRTLTQQISLGLSAFRREIIGNARQSFGDRSHDVASVSLSYTFARPIGR